MTSELQSGTATPAHDVVVVGSLNVDYTTAVRSIPRPGETVLGDDVRTFMGGKGLNQAVAAARAGARVAMIGRVGDDEGGARMRNRLRADGVDDTWIGVDERSPSGAAFITVDDNSENAIVVSPGANATLGVEHVRDAAAVIERAGVLLVQFEVPMAAVAAAVDLATGTVVVNPAPAQPLPGSLFERAAIVIPNRSELATIAGAAIPQTEAEVMALASAMMAEWGDEPTADAGTAATDRRIVITLGADGVLLVEAAGSRRFAAPAVDAVDTTGAGDCFCGSLAARLALGDGIDEAIPWAMAAAAISVTRPGASDSMPSADEVADVLLRNP
ncbi:MAG: ribokinase [Acidimicrobiia bacterium]|nr:ribokinase [Acidimicrobiia bacterium]